MGTATANGIDLIQSVPGLNEYGIHVRGGNVVITFALATLPIIGTVGFAVMTLVALRRQLGGDPQDAMNVAHAVAAGNLEMLQSTGLEVQNTPAPISEMRSASVSSWPTIWPSISATK